MTKPGVIYLLKDRFQLYSPFLKQIVEFRFVPEIVRDSDIINKDLLENLIKVFITNGKIPPSSLYIVLADNAYFVKDFVLPAPPAPQKGQPPPPAMSMETIQVLSMDFIEHVPYENVVSKTIPVKNGLRVCAVNKDFYDAIGGAFEKLGFKVEGVFPSMALGNNLTTKPVLDGSIVNTVLSKAASFKDYNLLHEEVYVPEIKKGAGAETSVEMELEDFAEQKKKPDKKRLFTMVGVLAVLLIILAVVAITSNSQPAPQPLPAIPVTSAPVAPSAAPEVSEAPVEEETSPTPKSGLNFDPEESKLLTVQLTNTSAPAASVEKLRTALGKFNFASMNTNSQPSLSASQTIVIFSVLPSTQMRAAVLLEVKKITPNVQVQEKSDASQDITILLGK